MTLTKLLRKEREIFNQLNYRNLILYGTEKKKSKRIQ